MVTLGEQTERGYPVLLHPSQIVIGFSTLGIQEDADKVEKVYKRGIKYREDAMKNDKPKDEYVSY